MSLTMEPFETVTSHMLLFDNVAILFCSIVRSSFMKVLASLLNFGAPSKKPAGGPCPLTPWLAATFQW